jgi:hypothetical protein
MTQQVATCPKCGQASSESDFCSECGARLGSGGALVSTVAPPAPASSGATPVGLENCPTCQTPRPSSDARFCEVCRYDFIKQTAGGPPVVSTAVPQADPPEAAGAGGQAALQLTPTTGAGALSPDGLRWDAVIRVDPSLDTDPDPELKAPEEPERRIPLDKAENLIGRRDANQSSSVPDVRPHDPSVSRRHAKLLIHPDGSVAILDLESANGTFVNGEQILAGVPHSLMAGDVITIGRWTRLCIEPRSNP